VKQWKPGSLVWQGSSSYEGTLVTVFFCGACGYKSPNSGNVRMHAMIHTGELPYSCPACSKGFRRRDRMQRHLANLHGIYANMP
jgi:uncharacterized Zn-finger protein